MNSQVVYSPKTLDNKCVIAWQSISKSYLKAFSPKKKQFLCKEIPFQQLNCQFIDWFFVVVVVVYLYFALKKAIYWNEMNKLKNTCI